MTTVFSAFERTARAHGARPFLQVFPEKIEYSYAQALQLVDAIAAGQGTRELMGACFGPTLKLPTSLAFGGPDGRTVYVGSLAGNTLATFQAPVAGATRR